MSETIAPLGSDEPLGVPHRNRQHKRGKNRYTLSQFGLEAAAIEASFADYRARFLPDTIGP